MVGNYWVNNLLPSIILGNFKFQRYMRGHNDTRNMLGLEGGPLWPRLDYPFSNPIEKSILKELV
jgi:hypothetical protein